MDPHTTIFKAVIMFTLSSMKMMRLYKIYALTYIRYKLRPSSTIFGKY